MERRASERIRRRVPCSFDYDGHPHKGLVVDVSAGGLFLQTDHAIPLGSELTLRLHHGSGEIELRVRVARRRFTPTVIASLIRRGVGVQILSAPEAYREVLRTAEPQPDAAWSALSDLEPPFERPAPEGLVSLDVVIAAEPPRPPPMVVLPLAAEPSEGLAEEAAADPGFGAWDDPDGSEAARQRLEARLAADAAEAAPEPVPVLEPAWAPESRIRADALLLHAGELADVERLLAELDATRVRQATVEAGHFAGWERPPRLIVASGRTALRLSMGTNLEAQGVVTIAVVDSESQTLCGMLRRQGFRYVVRRPVHAEALRLLLGRALFRGRERREAQRVALGCEVGLRLGLRRRSALLIELSRTGCRMLASDWVEPGDHLSLRIPSTATGNRPLQLGGRVLRSERPGHASGAHDVAVALRFERLDGATRMRLEALIAAHTLGPASLGAASAAGASEPERVAPEAPQDAERRRGPRVPLREEVVALDPDLARVRHTLLGIDLSDGGIRVEPHPDLAIGDRLRLAIYDAGSSATLVIEAEAARDEGARGVVLRFRNVSAETAAQIARITGAAPQIESAGSAEGSGVVVAEMLAHQPA